MQSDPIATALELTVVLNIVYNTPSKRGFFIMCNKVSYQSKSDASKDAKLVRVNSKRFSNGIGTNNKASKLYPYLCPICDNWHLTSLAKNIAKTFRKKNVNIRKTDKREV